MHSDGTELKTPLKPDISLESGNVRILPNSGDDGGFSSLLTAGGMLDSDSSRRNRRDKAIAPRDGRLPTLGQMANDYRKIPAERDGEEIQETSSNEPLKSAPMTEATGRWTKLEHETFLKALRKYGKEWKKVAAMVHTRTVVQTRTHAQKYFQKMNKSSSSHAGGGDESEGEDSEEEKPKVWGNSVKRAKVQSSHGTRAASSSPPEVQFSPLPVRLQVNTSRRMSEDFSVLTAPSPAACGKRRVDELAAAQVLIQSASPSQVKASEVLSAMKATTPMPLASPFERRRPLQLKVLNPESLREKVTRRPSRSASMDEPQTPWDTEVERMMEPSESSSHDIAMRSELHYAVLRGSLLDVKRVIVKMSQEDFMGSLVHVLNQPDDKGSTPLLSAAALTDIEGGNATKEEIESMVLSIALVLLQHGADPTVTDWDLNTVLHWASARGRSLVLSELLKYHACTDNVNSLNKVGESALHWASALGQHSCIRMLIDAGANINLRNTLSQSPLDVAGRGLGMGILSTLSVSEEVRMATRRTLYSCDPRCRTLVLTHKDCLGHKPRTETDWECPERVTDIMNALNDPLVFNPNDQEVDLLTDFDKASAEFLGRAHCAEYIKFVSDLARQMKSMGASQNPMPFTPQVRKHLKTDPDSAQITAKNVNTCDTSFSVGSLDAARRAAGAVMTAVDRVLRGRNRNAFCVVRPPGHHAGRKGLLADASSHGFCIFNSVAAGALHALEAAEHRLSRVAIVDIDVHHGNGTEEIVRTFQSPERLLFFSIHLYDKDKDAPDGFEFYPGSGAVDQTPYNIINVPLVPLWKASTPRTVTRGRTKRGEEDMQATQTGRRGFRQAIMGRLLPALRAFNPELVLLSSGFDGGQSDVGNGGVGDSVGLDLTAEDFLWVTKEIQQIANMTCGGKVVSVLEGGYGCKVDMSKPGSFGNRSVTQTPISPGEDTVPLPTVRAQLDRTYLATSACAHLRGLIDPYAPHAEEAPFVSP